MIMRSHTKSAQKSAPAYSLTMTPMPKNIAPATKIGIAKSAYADHADTVHRCTPCLAYHVRTRVPPNLDRNIEAKLVEGVTIFAIAYDGVMLYRHDMILVDEFFQLCIIVRFYGDDKLTLFLCDVLIFTAVCKG